MSLNVRTLARTIFSFLLTAVFLYLAFRNANLTDLWNSLKSANLWWIAALVPIGLLSHWVRALRWKYLLAPVKRNARGRNLFSAVMIGYMVNNILPRAGELVRAYVIGKSEGISKSSALGTVVVERILDTVTFLFMLCVILFLYPQSLDPFVDNVEAVRVYFLVGSLLLLVVSAFIFFKREALFGLIRFLKPLIPKRHAVRMDQIFESFLSGIGSG
ncbi:MAG: lysylphosphatidylglycerol synthase transmembrane domain-containing protein, partial [Bacteroidota bacterium]